jgi:hypothetical protein
MRCFAISWEDGDKPRISYRFPDWPEEHPPEHSGNAEQSSRIGGYEELNRLDRSGELGTKLAAVAVSPNPAQSPIGQGRGASRELREEWFQRPSMVSGEMSAKSQG